MIGKWHIMNKKRLHLSILLMPLLIAVTIFGAARMLVLAQDDETSEVEASIELTGAITSLSTTQITVSGLPIDISTVSYSGSISTGTVVTVTGYVNEEGIIVAMTLTVVGRAPPTPEATLPPLPTPDLTATPDDPDTVIVIEGPVQNILVNVITIYNIDITVAPENPVLTLIQIGDVIRVEGDVDSSGTIIAVVIDTISQIENASPDATVSLQGPIESIDGNIVVINGITVQLDPNDPQLGQLAVGNFLDVQGNFVVVNNVYVLVVVNVVIINNTFVGIPPYCYWHGMGGMGHWHCEEYWLYPGYWYCDTPGMGMGMGMGMGPNDHCHPGMGMGFR
jgi:hypothetical protein